MHTTGVLVIYQSSYLSAVGIYTRQIYKLIPEPMQEAHQISYFKHLMLLFGLVVMGLIIGGILFLFVGTAWMGVSMEQVPAALNQPANANVSKFLNVGSTLLGFFIPALIYQRIIAPGNIWRGLGMKGAIHNRQLLLIFPITLAAMVLSGALGMLNEQIPLSESLMKQAREMEEAYRTTMLNMAQMKGIPDLLLSLVVMALAPAIFEEVLFRGALQTLFIQWTRRPWLGIVLASIIFSAVHFSYFGFLPRMALGMVLGYIFYYSQNLWLSILMHFLNNGFIVVQLYLIYKEGKSMDEAMNDNLPIWTAAIVIPILVYLFWQYRSFARTSPANA